MGMILRIASSRIVGQGDIVGRSGYFSLNLSANSVMRGRLDARRTLKSLVADLRVNKCTKNFDPESAIFVFLRFASLFAKKCTGKRLQRNRSIRVCATALPTRETARAARNRRKPGGEPRLFRKRFPPLAGALDTPVRQNQASACFCP